MFNTGGDRPQKRKKIAAIVGKENFPRVEGIKNLRKKEKKI